MFTILVLIALAAIALVALIGSSLSHLSSLDRVATTSGMAASQPTTDPDDADDPAPNDPLVDATQPTLGDRSVFLSAADAKLTGPRIALLSWNNVLLKNGAGPVAPDVSPFGFGGFGFRGGGGRRRRTQLPPFLTRWTTPEDCVEWVFESPAEATYTVSFVFAGPPSQNGNKSGGPFVVSAGDSQIIVSPKPATNGYSFELADLGELHLPKGQVHLSVRPQGAVTYENSIELRSVRLFPNQ